MWNTKKFIKTYFLLIALVLVLLIVGVSYLSSKPKEKEGLAASTTKTIITTTSKPVITTNVKPIITTTSKPVITTTVKPIITTTSNPVITTTVKPIITTTSKPVITTTTKPIITTTSKPVITTTQAPATTLSTGDPTTTALQNLKNILQNIGPFPDPSEFDTYRFNNPCKILANLKPIGNAPAPSKTLAPSRAVTSFQEVINKLVEACITAETKNESSYYMKVSQQTIGYAMYLKKILDNIKAVDTTKPANVAQLSYILRNNLLSYTDNNSTYYVPLDVMITYINAHLNFLINSGVYNPIDTPDFICNFDNLSVAQYGYIQNFTINILQFVGAVVDIKVPLDNSIRAKMTSDMPRSVLLLQTLNNNDTKNMKLLG